MQKRQRKRWKSIKHTKIAISEDERCDPEQDSVVHLTGIISWFKLQAARKSLKPMKLTIKKSFKSERSEPEKNFSARARIYEELIKNPMKWTVLCICARTSIASPSECFLFGAEIWRETIRKIGLENLISNLT